MPGRPSPCRPAQPATTSAPGPETAPTTAAQRWDECDGRRSVSPARGSRRTGRRHVCGAQCLRTKRASVSVALVVATDAERDYDLGLGDTFPVRDETWTLDRVENLPNPDWWVVLRKVG
ncbi:DUF6406 domain-containing protein [Streptomyces sp. NPDC005525]|uniref:DUF6406 domain-containing protein n=1 Tax=Streptomyces sp. NPDC005525 TaxID=3364720 RepID=UPI0036BF6CE7